MGPEDTMRTLGLTLALALTACEGGDGDGTDTDVDTDDTEVVDTDDTEVVDTDDTDDTDVATTWDPDGDGCPDALATIDAWVVDSCGHLFLQLAPEAGRLRVFVTPELDASTYEPDASYVFEAPDAGADLVVERGPWVEEPGCDDVLEHTPTVLETWNATLGTLTVTVSTTADTTQPWGERLTTGTITLEGFTVQSETSGVTCDVPDVTIDTTWGWYAG